MTGARPADARPVDARPVDVAVGVVIRVDGRVLLGQRPAGKPYAGWWEFPGGKFEPGETVEHALARELDEELGLRVAASHAWVIREFTYPHAKVRLHFRRVFDFSGEPRGLEGQAFDWLRPDGIGVAPLLPATVPVVAWLRLPPACIGSAAAALGEAAFVDALERRLLARRVPMLLLDEPALAPARFEALFYRVRALCRAHRVPLLVSDAHAPSFARAVDGMLWSVDALRAARGRPALPLAGARIETLDDAARAAALGLDFALLGAPMPLPGEPALPVYAPAPTPDAAVREGAHGMAADGAFWHD